MGSVLQSALTLEGTMNTRTILVILMMKKIEKTYLLFRLAQLQIIL